MKPIIHVFDNFADADRFAEEEQSKLTPSERIELCYKISMAGWVLRHGSLPKETLRSNPIIVVKDLKDRTE